MKDQLSETTGYFDIIPSEIISLIFQNIDDPLDFKNLQLVRKLFKEVIDHSPKIQEKLRSALVTRIKGQTLLPYLNSARIQEKIKQGKVTANQALRAVQSLSPSFLEKAYQAFSSGAFPSIFTSYGHEPSLEIIHMLALHALAFGCLPQEVRYNWFSLSHLHALKAGVPWEVIEELPSEQVRAIMFSHNEKNMQFATPLTRKEIENIPLTDQHITALEKNFSFSLIKTLTEIQVRGLLAGFSETQVKSRGFSLKHIEVVNSGLFTADEITDLNEMQLKAYLYGVPKEDLLALHGTDLDYTHLQLLAEGIPWNKIKNSTGKISHPHLVSLLKQDSTILDKIIKCEEKLGWEEYAALQQGHPLEVILTLSPNQREALGIYRLTLEQVQAPDFSYPIAKLSSDKYPYETLKNFPIHQVKAFIYARNAGLKVEIEDFKAFTPGHTLLFTKYMRGSDYHQIASLTSQEVMKVLFSNEKFHDFEQQPAPPSSPVLRFTQPVPAAPSKDPRGSFQTQKELNAALEQFQKEEEEKFNLNKKPQ